MAKRRLTQARVRELFRYRADGKLVWRIKRGGQFPGSVAGSFDRPAGYYQVSIDGYRWSLHRIIFLWHHGYLPKEIDHINRKPTDNRIENLRSVTRTQNIWNGSRNRNAKGAYLDNRGFWRARAAAYGKVLHLGYFRTETAARRAYIQAKKRLQGEACSR